MRWRGGGGGGGERGGSGKKYYSRYMIFIILVFSLIVLYGRHHDLVNPYNVAVSRIVSDVFASDAP